MRILLFALFLVASAPQARAFKSNYIHSANSGRLHEKPHVSLRRERSSSSDILRRSSSSTKEDTSSSSSSSFSSSASTTSSLSTEPLLECFDATTETTFRVPFSQFYNSSFLIETDARDTSTRTKRKRKRKRKRKFANSNYPPPRISTLSSKNGGSSIYPAFLLAWAPPK
mmetsp:Transcript_24053/g.51206  ORF Transcript_24053/g.51206 Transcript_24053/m.51206 type:complete len:170 (+) Transcript_24053:131-640(+)